MNPNLIHKIKESVFSVLPITLLVVLLGFTITPMPLDVACLFLMGAVLLIVGMGLFSLGTDMAMTPMGEAVGAAVTRTRKLWFIVAVSVVIGIIITIAEPDLSVLAQQISMIPNLIMILSVAAGVGLFLGFAMLRIVFRLALKWILLGLYILIFLLAVLLGGDFIPVAFDAGGVTTGPITVPFILAMGVGVASIRSDRKSQEDSFGLVALSSVGPILAVMLLGLFYRPEDASYTIEAVSAGNSAQVARIFLQALPHYAGEVALALIPICGVFLIFNLITHRFHGRRLSRLLIGLVYTYIGLVLFLCGANVGFLPAGSYLGSALAGSEHAWLLVPLTALMGYFIVKAEPAVQVLNHQVENITSGAVPQERMEKALSWGVGISAGLSMVRVLTGLPILYLLIPGYALALILSFQVPPIFVGIAFDSGGVASGPMTATFLLPMAMGACNALGGNLMADAFGVVAMVAMTPLIAVQLMGMQYKHQRKELESVRQLVDAVPDTILDYEEVA